MEPLSVSVQEMAELLKISKPTAYKLVHTNGFPVLNLGRRKIIPYKKFTEWLEQNKGWEINCK